MARRLLIHVNAELTGEEARLLDLTDDPLEVAQIVLIRRNRVPNQDAAVDDIVLAEEVSE